MNAPTAKPTLYQLVDSLLAALDQCDRDTGEVPPDVAVVLDIVSGSLADKIEACAAVIARLEAEEAACKEMAASYAAKEKARGNEVARVKSYVLEQMQRAKLARSKGAVHTVWLAESKRVDVTDVRLLEGSRFMRVVPAKHEPDKKAIKAALDAGEAVDGARLVTDEHVRWT